MRRTILSLLADKAMTETQLAAALGLTEGAVLHHLKGLLESKLIILAKKEPEAHGILQKFYRASTLSFVIDLDKMPQEISRYFFPINIERIRGVISTLQIVTRSRDHISSPMLESLADILARNLVEVAENYEERDVDLDREKFTVKLYREALLKSLSGEEEEIQHLRKELDQYLVA